MPDYYDDDTAINDSENYESLFESRGVKFIKQHRTKLFDNLDLTSVRCYVHYWSYGDTLHKLSIKYLGTPMHWWLIGLVNGKPTDAHYTIGEKVLVPKSPAEIKRKE